MRQAIAQLKKQIKLDTETARAISHSISALPRTKETAETRERMWESKRAGRRGRRYRLLAYAMLRGVAYASVEPHCKSKPHFWEIHSALRKVPRALLLWHQYLFPGPASNRN